MVSSVIPFPVKTLDFLLSENDDVCVRRKFKRRTLEFKVEEGLFDSKHLYTENG